MATINKQSCPTCGQSVNKKEENLNDVLVKALFTVVKYAQDRDMTEVKMKEIRPFISSQAYSRLSYLKKFLPEMVSGSRGVYEFNFKYLNEFFAGKRKVCIQYLHDPLQQDITFTKYGFIEDVKSMKEFLDNNEEYVAMYRGRAETNQTALL